MKPKKVFELGSRCGTLTLIALPHYSDKYNGTPTVTVRCDCGFEYDMRYDKWNKTFTCRKCAKIDTAVKEGVSDKYPQINKWYKNRCYHYKIHNRPIPHTFEEVRKALEEIGITEDNFSQYKITGGIKNLSKLNFMERIEDAE